MPLTNRMPCVDELVKLYFRKDFNVNKFLSLLVHKHSGVEYQDSEENVSIAASVQEENHSSLEEVAAFTQAGIAGNVQMQGHQRLRLQVIHRGYLVSQDTIRRLIMLFDPEGPELRCTWCWRQMYYCKKGPNVLRHMDL